MNPIDNVLAQLSRPATGQEQFGVNQYIRAIKNPKQGAVGDAMMNMMPIGRVAKGGNAVRDALGMFAKLKQGNVPYVPMQENVMQEVSPLIEKVLTNQRIGIPEYEAMINHAKQTLGDEFLKITKGDPIKVARGLLERLMADRKEIPQ